MYVSFVSFLQTWRRKEGICQISPRLWCFGCS